MVHSTILGDTIDSKMSHKCITDTVLIGNIHSCDSIINPFLTLIGQGQFYTMAELSLDSCGHCLVYGKG